MHGAAGAIFKSFDCEEKAHQFLAAAVSVATVASKRSSVTKTVQRESSTMLSETQLDDLSNEQKSVVEAVLSGHNVFLTGAKSCAKAYFGILCLFLLLALVLCRAEHAALR